MKIKVCNKCFLVRPKTVNECAYCAQKEPMSITPVIITENTETGETKVIGFNKRKPAKKVFAPKVGGYFYAVHSGQVRECRISSITPTRRPFDAEYVKFRDTKTKKLHERYLSVSAMAMTKKQAKAQLVKALKKELTKYKKEAKDANGELSYCQKELNKALRIKV